MEIRLRILLLTLLLGLSGSLSGCATLRHLFGHEDTPPATPAPGDAGASTDRSTADDTTPPRVIEPEVERRDVKVPRIKTAHAALECVEHATIEIGRSRIVLGRVVAMYVEDEFVDPAGPYIKSEELHAIGRMNGLGSYVKTRDAFLYMPRIPYAEWEKGRRE